MSEHCPTCDALLKRCPRCGETKPADRFTRSKTAASQLSSWCRDCQRDHREDPERKARQREASRARTALLTQRRRAARAQREDAGEDARSLEERLAALERTITTIQAT
jgi:hypothetical protein